MVTKRFVQRDGKAFGPYYYESYRDSSGKVRKRYLKDYTPPKENKNLTIVLTIIGLLAILLLAYLMLSQEYSHRTLTGRTIYQAKEIYSPGEPLTGDILFNLRQGESIPKDTKVVISLGDFQQEFILSDFVDYEPVQGTIYAENSGLSGEGMVFGIPGVKSDYQEVQFELEIYTEQETEESPEEVSEEPTESQSQETPEEPAAESQEPVEETPAPESENTPAPITGEAISENIVTTISGRASKDSPFTYQLEEGQKARIVEGSVISSSQEINENEISLDESDNLLTVTTEYAIEEEGFGKEFLGEENAMTFKINIEDLELKAASGELIIEISHDGKQIAYYEDTILVGENKTEEPLESTLAQIQDIPSLRIPSNENVVIDLQDYFSGAASYSAQIENIQVSVEGSLMQFAPEEGFNGARKAKLIAQNENEKLESNEFMILVSSGAVTIKTTREKITLGQPVKWKKEITKEQAEEKLNIEIPKEAENVEVKTVKDGINETVIESQLSPLTGSVVIEVNLNDRNQKPIFSPKFTKSFKAWFTNFKADFNKKLKLPTGKSVEEIPAPSEVIDISLEEPGATEYLVEYETPAPEAVEEETEKGKILTISAPSELGYTNVIAFTELDNTIPVTRPDMIKLYWHNYEYRDLSREEIQEAKTTEVGHVPEEQVIEEISTVKESPVLTGEIISVQKASSSDYIKEEVVFDAYDLDSDGFIDYIEWVVPHLSDQVYEIIIVITKAEHLDENRAFVSDIYDFVKNEDGIWSETISNGEYVRVTFERSLTNKNDITLVARANTSSSIEVLRLGENETLAVFSSILAPERKTIYLTSLLDGESQSTFDLKINGAVELDYIVDPIYNYSGGNLTAYDMAGTPSSPFDGSLVEASASNYTAINASDDSRWITGKATGDGQWDTQVFIFNLSGTNRASISVLNFSWEGYGETQAGYPTYLKVWNWSSGSWQGSTSYDFTSASDGVLSLYINSGVSDFVNATSGQVAFYVNTVKYVTPSTCYNWCDANCGIWDPGAGDTADCGTDLGKKCSYTGYTTDCTSQTCYCNPAPPESPFVYYIKDGSFTKLSDFIPEATSAEKEYTSFTKLPDSSIIDNALNLKLTEELDETTYLNSHHVILYDYPTEKESEFDLWFSLNFEKINDYNYKQTPLLLPEYIEVSVINSDNDYLIMNKGFSKELSYDLPVIKDRYARKAFFVAKGYYIQHSQPSTKAEPHRSLYTDYVQLNFTADAAPPQITIISPLDGTTVNAARFNISINEAGSCWYSLNGGTTNHTMTANASLTGFNATNYSISDGTYFLNYYCNDSFGNENLAEPEPTIAFFLDQTPPSIILNAPAANETLSLGNISFNWTVTENFGTPNCNLTIDSIVNVSVSVANGTMKNYTVNNTPSGLHWWNVTCRDSIFNTNTSATRNFTVAIPPSIDFASPTQNNYALTENTSLTIALSVTNYSAISTLRYRLYDSSFLLVNETFSSSVNLTFSSLAPGTYYYNVWLNDSANNNDTTSDRTLVIVPSCFNISTECIQSSSCVIEENCYLHSGMCTNSQCNFTIMTTNATIYTLYDSSGNGRSLKLTLTSNTQRAPILFLNNSNIIFSGRNGSDLGVGSAGGSAGTLNITVPDLLNTTNARFTGQGGYASLLGASGGNGGNLILNFHGLIRNFTDVDFDMPNNRPILTGGSSLNMGASPPGTITYNKDLVTCPRDADPSGNGLVYSEDVQDLKNLYGNVTGETGFNANYDINCDGKINVIDLYYIGREYSTR